MIKAMETNPICKCDEPDVVHTKLGDHCWNCRLPLFSPVETGKKNIVEVLEKVDKQVGSALRALGGETGKCCDACKQKGFNQHTRSAMYTCANTWCECHSNAVSASETAPEKGYHWEGGKKFVCHGDECTHPSHFAPDRVVKRLKDNGYLHRGAKPDLSVVASPEKKHPYEPCGCPVGFCNCGNPSPDPKEPSWETDFDDHLQAGLFDDVKERRADGKAIKDFIHQQIERATTAERSRIVSLVEGRIKDEGKEKSFEQVCKNLALLEVLEAIQPPEEGTLEKETNG